MKFLRSSVRFRVFCKKMVKQFFRYLKRPICSKRKCPKAYSLLWYTWLQFYYSRNKHGTEAKKEVLNILKREINRQVIPNGFNIVVIWVNLEKWRKEPELIQRGIEREKFKTLFYPSNVFPSYSVVTEEEDVLPELIEFCHSKGLKVLLYYTIKNSDEFVIKVGRELLEKYPAVDGLMVEGVKGEVLRSAAKEFRKIKSDVSLHVCPYISTTRKELCIPSYVPEGWEFWETLNHLPERHNQVWGPNCWLYLTASACDLEKEKFHTKESFRKLCKKAFSNPEIKGIGLFVHSPKCDAKPYADIIGECVKELKNDYSP